MSQSLTLAPAPARTRPGSVKLLSDKDLLEEIAHGERLLGSMSAVTPLSVSEDAQTGSLKSLAEDIAESTRNQRALAQFFVSMLKKEKIARGLA